MKKLHTHSIDKFDMMMAGGILIGFIGIGGAASAFIREDNKDQQILTNAVSQRLAGLSPISPENGCFAVTQEKPELIEGICFNLYLPRPVAHQTCVDLTSATLNQKPMVYSDWNQAVQTARSLNTVYATRGPCPDSLQHR